ADAAEFLCGKIAKSDAFEIRRIPAAPALVSEVSPLADRGAERARVIAGGAVGEEIRQIEEARRTLPGLGQMLFQPEQLGRLHLGRNDAADVTQDWVTRAIDRSSFGNRAMVHPDNHVLSVAAGGADGHGPVVDIEHHERTGGVEADAG